MPSLWDLLQQSPEHRNVVNNIIKAIELDKNNLNYIRNFIGIVQSATRHDITFFQDEIQHPPPDKLKHPTLYIVAYANSCPSKRVLVDNGSMINAISYVVLEILKVPIHFLNVPTITIRAFNNTLATTMGILVLRVKVGVRELTTTCHVVKCYAL